MAIPSLFNTYIDETYHRLVQTTGSGAEFADGLGNPISFGGATIPNGPINSLQYNLDGTNFSGSSNLTFSGSNVLTLTGSLKITGSTTQIGSNNLYGNTTLSGSIIISGSTTTPSVQIYGNTTHNGYIRFDPVTTNLDTSISASYIYVSGSTNDLYFSQNGNGYANTTRLRWLEGNLYTGLLNGGLITTQSSTVYQISSGSGIIVNLNASIGNNPYPTIQYLNWPNLSASIASLSASYDQQFVAVSSSAGIPVIKTSGTPFNDGDYNNFIPIGIVIHQNHSTINAVQTFPSVAYGWKQRSYDFIRAFGPLKISGYTLSPSGSSTRGLVLSGGTAWVDGRNYIVDPNNPSYITEATGITTSKIYRYYQSGSGGNNWGYDTNNGAGYTAIDPTLYSNNGALTAVPTNNWTIQRVFYFPNSATKAFYIYYGNDHYANKTDAIAAITTETFLEAPNTAANAILVGYMILRHNADFTVAASYEFRAAGLFRSSGQGGAAGGGGGATTLDALTDVQLGTLTDKQNLVYDLASGKWINTYTLSGSLTGQLIGTASWAQSSSNSINAQTASNIQGGTNTYIPLWSGATTLTTSSIQQTGYTLQTISGSDSCGISLDLTNKTYRLGSLGDNTVGGIQILNNPGSNSIVTSPNAFSSFTGLNIDFINKLYQLGDFGISYNGTYLDVNDNSSYIKTKYTGGDIGLLLDFNNGVYKLGDHAWVGDGGYLHVDGNTIYAAHNGAQRKGLLLELDNGISELGDFDNIVNGTKIIVNDPNQTTTITKAVLLPDIGSLPQSNVVTIDTVTGQLYWTASSAIGGGSSTPTFPFSGSAVITGSLTVSGSSTFTNIGPAIFSGSVTSNSGFTGSLQGTASWATNALTASYVVTAQTASYVQTAQTASYVLQAVSASFATLAQTANTASYVVTAQTASYVLNAQTASYVLQAVSSSFASTASYIQNAQTASYVLQAVSASFATLAQTANTASYVVTAQTASYVLNAQTASYVLQAVSSSFATLSQTANTASYVLQAVSSSFASTASFVQTAQTASYVLQAVSASFATLAQTSNTASYIVTAQTASYVSGAVHNSSNPALSASYALTSSYAANGGVTQITAGSGISINQSTGNVTITSTGASGAGANISQSFTNQSTWTFVHGLGSQGVIIQTYDSGWNQIIPQNISSSNSTTAVITFPTNESGFAIASLGGSTTLAQTASYVNTLNQSVSVTGDVTASIFASTNNGNGTNFKVGDDAWIGDINTADTLGIKGQQNATKGYIKFGSGSSNPIVGSSGTSTLELTGSLNVTENITIPSRHAFSVYGSGTTSNLSTTTNTDGTLNSNNFAVSYTQGSGFNSSTGIFTAPIAGLYQVTLIGRNSGYSSGISQLAVLKNNSNAAGNVLMIEWASSSTMNHTGGSMIFKLAVNDTLRLKVLAGQINFDGNDNWSVAYIG